MDYPKSVANVGLVNGKFVDENTATGLVGSLIPAEWGNAVTDEILNVLATAGLTPDEQNSAQLTAAIRKLTNGRLVAVKVITATGTYTPTAGITSALVKAVGGGGGGASLSATSSSQYAVSGGGASGSYCEGLFSAAQLGASVAVTIGAGGAGGPAGGGVGAAGGTTTFGALMSAPGGNAAAGGALAASTTSSFISPGGVPGAVSTGGNILNSSGIPGIAGFIGTAGGLVGGGGGGSPLHNGAGGAPSVGVMATSGGVAISPGGGGGGVVSTVSSAAKPGSAGAPGAVIVWEFM